MRAAAAAAVGALAGLMVGAGPGSSPHQPPAVVVPGPHHQIDVPLALTGAVFSASRVEVSEPELPAEWPEQLSEGQVRWVLAAAGWPPDQVSAALAVAWCESRWRPTAVGDHGQSLGLWQLWSGWYEPGEDWRDPVDAAAAALRVWRSEGWEEWSCSSSAMSP